MLVEIDDLKFLSPRDLRAVLEVAGMEVVLTALWGVDWSVLQHLRRSLPEALKEAIETGLARMPTPTLEEVREARRRLLDVLARLSREGRIAFDLPEDLVA